MQLFLQKIMKLELAHTGFLVADMEKSCEFYTKLFGFKEMFTINDDDGEPWIRYMRVGDNSCIELCHCNKTKLDNNLNARRFSHICFEVDNIDELIKKVEENNVPFYIEPKIGKDNNRQFWIKDLDDNKIEFVQYDKSSPQSSLSFFLK